ncbi:MAG: hypothetical protein TREMPRED_000208, partial [Tremellales sp. Tagirdzhanova-0007]
MSLLLPHERQNYAASAPSSPKQPEQTTSKGAEGEAGHLAKLKQTIQHQAVRQSSSMGEQSGGRPDG